MTDSPRLTGQRALVTGASRGIGREVAVALAMEGASVRGLGRDEAALRALAGEHDVVPVVTDLRDDTAVWTALDEMMDRDGGPPHIVVNAAGVFGIAAVAEESVKGFDAQIELNLRAPFIVTRIVLPGMLERGSGSIVNIGSVAGRKAFPGNAAYSASKFGLRGFHEVLVEELTGTGIRATLVEPAATDTALWDPLDPDHDPTLPNRSAMLRCADVAEAVVFVATRRDEVRIPSLRVERS